MTRLPSPAAIMAKLKRAGLKPRLRVDTRAGTWEIDCEEDEQSTEDKKAPNVADLIDGVRG